jgi:hypothetical protein
MLRTVENKVDFVYTVMMKNIKNEGNDYDAIR